MAHNGDPRDEYTTHTKQWEALKALQANLAKLVRAAGESVPENADEILKQTRIALDAIAAMARDEKTGTATLGQVVDRYWDTLTQQKEAASTGLDRLDAALGGGFQPGKLVALLGGPGVGKTTLANQIAEHVANSGRPVAYLTMEDTPHLLLCKTVARLSGVNYSNVQRPDSSNSERIRTALADVSARTSASRLLYLDEFVDTSELQDAAGAHFAQYADGSQGLLVVDYLQRIARAGAGDREMRIAVGALTDQLRTLARSLDCSVLALVSQNRAGYESDGDKVMTSAKESGDIEYGCDVVMALIKDKDRQAPIGREARKLFLAKNRQGEADRPVLLDWSGGRQMFTTVDVGAR
jgi:replicative DNA helicase